MWGSPPRARVQVLSPWIYQSKARGADGAKVSSGRPISAVGTRWKLQVLEVAAQISPHVGAPPPLIRRREAAAPDGAHGARRRAIGWQGFSRSPGTGGIYGPSGVMRFSWLGGESWCCEGLRWEREWGKRGKRVACLAVATPFAWAEVHWVCGACFARPSCAEHMCEGGEEGMVPGPAGRGPVLNVLGRW